MKWIACVLMYMIYWSFMHLLLMPTDLRHHVGCRCPSAKVGAMRSATIKWFQMISWPAVIFVYDYYKQYVICYFHVQNIIDNVLLREWCTLNDPYLIVEKIVCGKNTRMIWNGLYLLSSLCVDVNDLPIIYALTSHANWLTSSCWLQMSWCQSGDHAISNHQVIPNGFVTSSKFRLWLTNSM